MRAANAERYEAGLAAALARLRGVDMSDRDAVWQATFEVLAWLYLCEEVEKRPDPCAYHDHRRLTDDGCTLGGLIGLRGRFVHEQADFEDVAPVSASWGGEPMVWDGEPVMWGVEPVWPSRHAIWPDVADEDLDNEDLGKGERVRMYKEHVAGQQLLPPLERAQRYLLSR